jgi:ammonia channel protein AmtB
MREEDFLEIGPEDQDRIIEYNNSVSRKEEAKAQHEHKKGRRLLFERAPPETLPFIVYCIFVSADALIGTFLLISQQAPKIYLLPIVLAMILPMIVLYAVQAPNWSEMVNWLKEYIGGVR